LALATRPTRRPARPRFRAYSRFVQLSAKLSRMLASDAELSLILYL